MSRTKHFLSGVGFGYASQTLTILVGLWLTPFLLGRIGQHDYGLWLVGTQIMFYLGLLDLGVVALLPREAAFATGRAGSVEKATDLPLIIGQTARMVLWQMPLVALAALAAWLVMPGEWEALRQPMGLVLLAFVAVFPLRIFGAALQGLQDLAYIGKAGILSYLVSTAITVGLVFAGLGLYALALGWAAMQIIIACASWHRLRTHFHAVLPDGMPSLLWDAVRSRLKQGFWVSVNQIASVLLSGTDLLIIGKSFGPAAVVPFVVTGKLISVMANQPQMLMQTAGPALSQMRVSETRERLSQVCVALSQAMLMLSGAVVCVILAVNQGFIERWVGGDQYGGLHLTTLFLLNMLLRHWNLTVGYTLFCFCYERRLALTALLDGVVSVGGAIIFVRLFGIAGAPMGMIAGVCLVSLPLNLWTLAGESGMSVRGLILPLWPWFIRFAILVTAAATLARIWTPGSIWLVGVIAIAIALVYCGVMLPIALRSPLGIYVRPRLFPITVKVSRALGLSNSI
jgi:O-antigen/teichoic acid export membrane protein